MKDQRFAHVRKGGAARMVDVSAKRTTLRSARAEASVRLGPEVARMLRETGSAAKGNVLETARIAAIQAAKRTPELIPLCHPIAIDRIDVRAELEGERLRITVDVGCRGPTGVEMEAMTAAAIGALTVYDMCKSAEKGITIETIRLLAKKGGKSGTWKRDARSGRD